MKFLLMDDLHPALKEGLINMGHEVTDNPEIPREDLPAALKDQDAIIVRSRFHIDREIIDWAPHLKIIARAGAGMDNVDETYATQKGIICIHAAGANAVSVAEHVIGMLLMLFNRLNLADLEIRNGVFDREGNRGIELYGKTVGIIGYGHTGSAVANRMAAFGCKVLAYDKYKKGFGNNDLHECGISDIYEHADILSFHVPLTEETLFMGNEQFFHQFKKKIYIINASRGKVVKLNDLLLAINQKIVSGAVLDVLENEKIHSLNAAERQIFHALTEKKEIVFSPHVAGWTHESYRRISMCLLDKIREMSGS